MIEDNFTFANQNLALRFVEMKNSDNIYQKTFADGLLSSSSFIDQLLKEKLIASPVFSIFPGGHIKFGGFDNHANLRGTHLVDVDLNADLSVPWETFSINEEKLELT